MKKLVLLLTCLALILGVSLACGALAEDLLELRFEDSGADGYQTTRAIFQDSEDGTLYHNGWIRNYYVDDYEALASVLDGVPQWSFEPIGDTHGVRFEWNNQDWEVDTPNRALELHVFDEPDYPCTVQYKVTCSWGGQSKEANGTINYDYPNTLPESMDVDTEIRRLQVGQEYPLVLNWTPVNYGFGYGRDFHIDFDRDFDCEGYWDWDEENNVTTLYITPHEAGIFPARISANWANIRIEKRVVLFVRDENNIEPKLEIEIEPDDGYEDDMPVFKVPMFLPGYDDKGYQTRLCEGESTFIQPRNYEVLETLYGDNWDWTFQLVNPNGILDNDRFYYYMDDNLPCNFVMAVHDLESISPGTTAEVEATLRWGDLTKTCALHYTFDNVELPDSIEWPSELNLIAGKENPVYIGMDPEDIRLMPHDWGEQEHNNLYGLFYDFHGEQWRFDEDNINSTETVIVPHDPGVYLARTHLHAANLFIYSPDVIVYVADENGNEPEAGIELSDEDFTKVEEGHYQYETTRAIFEDSEDGTIYHNNWIRNYIIRNYDVLKYLLESEPEWSVEPVGDTHDIHFEWNNWDWEGETASRALDVHVDNEPDEPCDVQYKVTCSWGDREPVVVDCTIHYVDSVALPESLEIPPEVHGLKVDERFELPIAWTPSDYTFGNDDNFHIDFDRDFDCDNYWEWVNGVPTQFIVPHEPGVFPVRISANWANIRIEKNVLLYVADENNEEPAFALRFEDDRREEYDVYDYHTARAIFEDNPDIGLFHDSWVRNYIIRDFDTLRGILEGDPVWSVEPYGEDTRDVEFYGHNWDWEGDWGKRAFDVSLDNEPMEPCTIQYRVTCSWGDAQPAVAICTIDYEYPTNPLPQSLDIDNEHDLRIHEEYPLVVNWSPENCGFGYGYDFRVNFDQNFECENHWDWDEENGITYQYITPHESGIFPACLSVNWANVRLEKDILLFVADENGNEPSLEFAFADPDCENFTTDRAIFDDNPNIGLFHDDWVRNYEIKNFYALRVLNGGEPEWRVIPDADDYGVEFEWYNYQWEGEDALRGLDVQVHGVPDGYDTIGYTVECEWGGETLTAHATLNYVVPASLPESMDIDTEYHGLQVDGEYDLPVAYTPGNYSFGDGPRICFDTDSGIEWEPNWSDDGMGIWYSPHEYGVHGARVRAVWSNISLQKEIALFVGDENGDPELELEFGDDANETKSFSVDFESSDTVFQDNWCGDVEIWNYDAMHAVFGGEPEWHASADDESLRVDLDNMDGGRRVGVHLENLPRNPGDTAITVTCDWGDKHTEATKCIHFIKCELPDDGTVDQVYRMKPGEPTRVYVNFDPDFEIDGSRLCYWFHDEEMYDYMETDEGEDENGHWVEFTPYEGVEGIFCGPIYICSGNVCAGRWNVAFVISEDEEYTFKPVWDAMENRVYAIGPQNDRIGVCIDPFLHYARMENYYAGEAFFGERGEWDFEFVGDNAWDARAETREPFEYLIWLEDEDVPQEPDTATLRVTVSFGDVSFSHDCEISFDYYNLPEGGDLPDELHLVAGKTQRVEGSFIPADYTIPGADNFGMYFECYAETDFEWERDEDEYAIDVTFNEIGVYPAHIQLEVGNVRFGKDILVFVGDGETEPEDVLQVQGGPNFDEVAILNQWWEGDFGEVGLHTEDIMADFWFEDGYYDVMYHRLGEEPDWRYHQEGGDDIVTALELDDDDSNPRHARLSFRNLPEQPEEVTFTVTCDWTEQYHFEKTFTIRFVDDVVIPESLNIDDDIYMNAGEDTEIEYSVTPEGWNYDPDSRHFDFWPVGDRDVDHDMWLDDEGRLMVRIEEPGTYVCCVFLREGSIVLPKRYVTFHVKDPDEEEYPALEFRFTDEAMYEPENTFLIFDEQEDIGLIHDDFVTYLEIEDFYGMRTRKEGDPVWTLEQLDHQDEVELRAQTYEWEDEFDAPRGFQVFASGLPETECDVHYQVTCEWDGESIEWDGGPIQGVLHFVDADHLPEDVDIPTVINLKLDRENAVDLRYLPEGFEFFDDEDFNCIYNPRINIDWHDDFDREDWNEGHTLIIRPYQEGAFHAWVGVTACNLNFGKEVVFVVTRDGETEALEMQGGPWFEEVAIGPQMWEGDFGEIGLHTEDVMADYNFPETAYYARKAELGTEPVWNLTMQGADEGEFELWLDEDNNNPKSATVLLRSMPEQPENVTFTVTCDWDDFHYEDTFTISFVDNVLPESLSLSLNIDDVIEMDVRRRTVIPYSVDPEGWHFADDRHFEIRVAGDQEYVDFHEEYDPEKDELSVYIDRAGTYSAIVFLREGSVVVPKRFVTFHVANRGGRMPAQNLNFEDDWMYDVHRTFAIFDEQEDIGLIHDDFVCEYRLDRDYDSIFIQKGSNPEWNVTWDNDEIDLRWNNFDWEGDHYSHRGIQLFAEGMPAEPCEVHFTVTCTWGDLSVEGSGVIEYVNTDLPTGVNIPDVIELRLNEENCIDLSFIPEDYAFGEDDRINYEFYDEFDRNDWEEEHSLFIVPFESGDFAGWVGVTSGNINFGKNVIFRVSDEEGNMPERVEPILWTHEVTYNIAIVPGEYDEQYGVRADNWVDDVGLKNHEAMLRTYGDNVTWTVEQTEGEDLQPWTEYREHGCAFFIDRQPTQTGTARFTITGDWGEGITTSIDYILNIIEPDALPTGVKLYHEGVEVDEITMTEGDTAYVTSEFEPDPDWRLPGREDREWLDTWLDGVDGGDNPYFNFDGDGYTAWFTAKQPGIYYMNTQARSGNVQAYRQLKVTVTDENGDVGDIAPILEGDFEMDIMLGELMGENNTGWLIRPNFWSMEPLNLQALREVYGDDAAISWNVEIVDGADVGVGYETYEVDGIENAGATFGMTSLPSEPCQSVIRITTGWNGNEASLQGTLNFVPQPANVPDTNTLPDRLYLRLGDTVEVEGYYPEGDWDVRQNFAWIGIGGVHVEEDYGNPHHLFLTGVETGTWYGEALVGQQARGMTRKWITIVVYDDSEYTTMTLPAALNVIDEEAFEGIAANKVIVPDGCERIEARAFMNCPNLREIHIPNSVYSIGDDVFSGCDDVVIITDNGVIQEWADNHDILWFNE